MPIGHYPSTILTPTDEKDTFVMLLTRSSRINPVIVKFSNQIMFTLKYTIQS
jgi:hypothetical protein